MTFLTNRDNMKKLKSYGNTGTPITMDMGGWRIVYAHPTTGLKRSFFKERTLMNAMAVFNSLDSTTGFAIAGDIIIDRIDTFGNLTDTWLMAGRYAVPQKIAS